MNRPPKEIMDFVLDNLKSNPKDWDISAFAARNPKIATEIWLANRYSGTTLKCYGRQWGGVTMWGTLFGYLMPWRRVLVAAVDKLWPPVPEMPSEEEVIQKVRATKRIRAFNATHV